MEKRFEVGDLECFEEAGGRGVICRFSDKEGMQRIEIDKKSKTVTFPYEGYKCKERRGRGIVCRLSKGLRKNVKY